MNEQPGKHEKILKGIPASPGIAMGGAYLFAKESPRFEERSIATDEIAPEIERLTRAIDKSAKELSKILLFAQKKVGDAKAKIFEAQIMVLEDPVLIDSIRKRVAKEQKNVEFIVSDEI